MLGMSTCYAGANIGEGATIWTTFFPAAAGALLLLGLWLLIEITTGISAHISIDCDLASGIRLAGLLIAIGLILSSGYTLARAADTTLGATALTAAGAAAIAFMRINPIWVLAIAALVGLSGFA